MSWRSAFFRRRMSISAPNTAGGATKDVNVVIPQDLDEFWDVIDTAGLELRVTAADGYTVLNYSVDNGSGSAFDRANRLGRIQIDGATAPGTATELLNFWLFFHTTSTQGTAAVATTIASALTGYIERGTPSTWRTRAQVPRPGLDRPRATFGKGSADEAFLWVDLTNQLELRRGTFAGKKFYEEPMSATYQVVDDAGAPQAGMITTAGMRWVEAPTGKFGRRIMLRLPVKGGTDDTRYTAVATILTSVPGESGTHRTITARAGFRVRDLLET